MFLNSLVIFVLYNIVQRECEVIPDNFKVSAQV